MSSTTCVGFILGVATIALTAVGGPRAYAQARRSQFRAEHLSRGEKFGQMPDDRKMGSAIGVGDRSRRQEPLGLRSVWRQQLRWLECGADHEIRSGRQASDQLRCRHVRVPAWARGRPRWQCVGDRRQAAHRGEVRSGRQGSDDARSSGRLPGDGNDSFNQPSDVVIAANGDIFVADGHGGKSNDRIVQALEGWEVHQGLGKARQGAGRVRYTARHRARFRRTRVRR